MMGIIFMFIYAWYIKKIAKNILNHIKNVIYKQKNYAIIKKVRAIIFFWKGMLNI